MESNLDTTCIKRCKDNTDHTTFTLNKKISIVRHRKVKAAITDFIYKTIYTFFVLANFLIPLCIIVIWLIIRVSRIYVSSAPVAMI